MPSEDYKEYLKKVNQFNIKETDDFLKLIEAFAETGFNAKRLARACHIYKEMVEDNDCTKFFGLAGALIPVGLQGVIHEFLDDGFIDIFVTTGASLTHDLAESLGFHHLQSEINMQNFDDAKLYESKLNRIYDVFLPNNVYEGIEDFVSGLEIPDNNMSVSNFLQFLGKQLPDNPNSILKVCAEKQIPIFCPAFTDSGLALQLGFHHRNLNLNHFNDMLKMVDLAWDSKHAGVCIVGGGVPKNFIFQSLQFCPTSAIYAIQITMDRPETGGLSGATLEEAISWGKVNEKAKYSTVVSDATIVLPLILLYLKKALNLK